MWSLRQHWFWGYAETRTAATASMAGVLWPSCARVASDSSGRRKKLTTGQSRASASKALASRKRQCSRSRGVRFVRGPKRAMGQKNGGQKNSFLEVAVAAPARVIVVSSSPLRRVALRDAMRALSCAPHAIAATFEDTAAGLAQERRGADDPTIASTPSKRRWRDGDVETYATPGRRRRHQSPKKNYTNITYDQASESTRRFSSRLRRDKWFGIHRRRRP